MYFRDTRLETRFQTQLELAGTAAAEGGIVLATSGVDYEAPKTEGFVNGVLPPAPLNCGLPNWT
jgi:hypothetical protein